MIVYVMNILNMRMKNFMFSSLLYSSMLIHGFLPDAMIITIIAPIIKKKAGDLSDNNNYRPIVLDASKAFDKVNHSKLFTKLIEQGCPFIVRILYYWYRTQKFTVRWCCSFSEFFYRFKQC